MGKQAFALQCRSGSSLDDLIALARKDIAEHDRQRIHRSVVHAYVRMIDDAAMAVAVDGAERKPSLECWTAATTHVRRNWKSTSVKVKGVFSNGQWTLGGTDDPATDATGRLVISLRGSATSMPTPKSIERYLPAERSRLRRIKEKLSAKGHPDEGRLAAKIVRPVPVPGSNGNPKRPAAGVAGDVRRFDIVIGRDGRVWIAVDKVGFDPAKRVTVVVNQSVSFVQSGRSFGTVPDCSLRTRDVLGERDRSTVELVEIDAEGRAAHHEAVVYAATDGTIPHVIAPEHKGVTHARDVASMLAHRFGVGSKEGIDA